MTTALDAALARHAQTVADLAAAEQALVRVMARIDPAFPELGVAVAEAVTWWSFMARLESPSCPPALAKAHAAYKRAQRAEAKAKSAALRAQLPPAPTPAPKPPARRTRKAKKVAFDAYVRERLAEEAEARAA